MEVKYIKAINLVKDKSPGDPWYGKLMLQVNYPHGLKVGQVPTIVSDTGMYKGASQIGYIYDNPAAKVSNIYFVNIPWIANDTGKIVLQEETVKPVEIPGQTPYLPNYASVLATGQGDENQILIHKPVAIPPESPKVTTTVIEPVKKYFDVIEPVNEVIMKSASVATVDEPTVVSSSKKWFTYAGIAIVVIIVFKLLKK